MASRSETVEAILFALCVGLFFGKLVCLEWKLRARKASEALGNIDTMRDLSSIERSRTNRVPLSLVLSLTHDLHFFLRFRSRSRSRLLLPNNSLPRLHLLPPASLPKNRLARARRGPSRAVPLARRSLRSAARQRDADGRSNFWSLFFPKKRRRRNTAHPLSLSLSHSLSSPLFPCSLFLSFPALCLSLSLSPPVRRPVDPQQHHGRVLHGLDLRADRRLGPAARDPGRGEDREAAGAGRAGPHHEGALGRRERFLASGVADRRVQAERYGARHLLFLHRLHAVHPLQRVPDVRCGRS